MIIVFSDVPYFLHIYIKNVEPIWILSGWKFYRKVSGKRREIRFKTFQIALTFDRHLSGSAAEMPVKCQSDTVIITPNFAASKHHEILRLDVRPLSE